MTDVPRRTEVLAMSNRTYDFLRNIALIWLPALGALYFGLAQIWGGLPYPEEVVGTIAVIDTFLGAILGYSRRQYNEAKPAFDGKLVVTPREAPQTDLYNLVLSTPIDDLRKREQLVFEVEQVYEGTP